MARLRARTMAGVHLILSVMLVTGCSTFAASPTRIIVADKDQQVRWDSQVVGLQTVPIDRSRDRVREVRRDELLREYWVKSSEGRWYRVSKADWEAARVGEALEIHPALPERVLSPSTSFPCTGPDGRWRC